MKFSKYNNPNKKRYHRKPLYSKTYIEERRAELNKLLSETNDPETRKALEKAFYVSINP